MVEHFHHGQRIADFVGHFRRQQAEGGKFFVLPQLFLHVHDALVEPGLFQATADNSASPLTVVKLLYHSLDLKFPDSDPRPRTPVY